MGRLHDLPLSNGLLPERSKSAHICPEGPSGNRNTIFYHGEQQAYQTRFPRYCDAVQEIAGKERPNYVDMQRHAEIQNKMGLIRDDQTFLSDRGTQDSPVNN
jgi:hypothetical protein